MSNRGDRAKMPIKRQSGYDPETGICWNFQNKGERAWYWHHRKTCPVCSSPYDQHQSVFFGRCRSGRRWFWVVGRYSEETRSVYGLEDSEELATAAAVRAVLASKTQSLMGACLNQGYASCLLKELNEAKRRERPASSSSEAGRVVYLYAYHGCWTDGWTCPCESLTGRGRILYHTEKFQIFRKTKKRIYYGLQPMSCHDDADVYRQREGTGYVDRMKLEAEGSVYNRGRHWSARDFQLYLSLEHLLRAFPDDRAALPDLATLKAEMAAAHPDHGGSDAAFIEARSRYVEARRGRRSASR